MKLIMTLVFSSVALAACSPTTDNVSARDPVTTTAGQTKTSNPTPAPLPPARDRDHGRF